MSETTSEVSQSGMAPMQRLVHILTSTRTLPAETSTATQPADANDPPASDDKKKVIAAYTQRAPLVTPLWPESLARGNLAVTECPSCGEWTPGPFCHNCATKLR